jgi:hypothetical protein
MKKKVFPILFLYLCWNLIPIRAQNSNGIQYPTLLKEVNHDIWAPFSQAVLDNDVTKLTALLAPDFMRIFSFQKKIENREKFSARMQKAFKKNKKEEEQVDNRPVNINFRYSERVITEAFASERGVCQITLASARGDVQNTWEAFHALSRKENGSWKLVSWYSSYENGNGLIDAQEYFKCVPIDVIRKF